MYTNFKDFGVLLVIINKHSSIYKKVMENSCKKLLFTLSSFKN